MNAPVSLQPTESDLLYLRGRWRALTSPHPASETKPDGWLDVLITLYSGPDRHYHNLRHVAQMLRLLEQFEEGTTDYSAVCFAAWFHDAVYDTRKRTNEEESGALAELALAELGVSDKSIDASRQLILATKRHMAEGGPPDAGIFLDADLSILGESEETYLAYSGAIRKEYSWVPDAAYREGRLKVLADFLERRRIFYTNQLTERFEERARHNISSEISLYSPPRA